MPEGYVDISPHIQVPNFQDIIQAIGGPRGEGLQHVGQGLQSAGTALGLLLRKRQQQKHAAVALSDLLRSEDQRDVQFGKIIGGLPPEQILDAVPKYEMMKMRSSAMNQSPMMTLYRDPKTGSWSETETPGAIPYQMKQSQAGQFMQQQAYQGATPLSSATPEQIRLAQSVADGNTNPRTLDYRGPLRRGVIVDLANELASQQGKPFRSYTAAVKEAGEKFFASGKGATSSTSLNMLMHHLDSAANAYENLAEKSALVGNTNIRLINIPINKLKAYTNDPDIIGLEANLVAVKDELATTFKGTSATDEQIKKWDSVITPDLTVAQYVAVLQKVNELAKARQSALEYQRGRFRSDNIYDTPLLSPDAEAAQKRIEGLNVPTFFQKPTFSDAEEKRLQELEAKKRREKKQ